MSACERVSCPARCGLEKLREFGSWRGCGALSEDRRANQGRKREGVVDWLDFTHRKDIPYTFILRSIERLPCYAELAQSSECLSAAVGQSAGMTEAVETCMAVALYRC